MTSHGTSLRTRLVAVLCSGLCVGANLTVGVAPSNADALLNMPIPYDVGAPEVAELWINPDARARENPKLGIDLLKITPGPYRPGRGLSVQLRITNNLDSVLSQVVLVPRRAEASPSVIESRTALTTGLEAFPWIGSETLVADTLQPGEHTDATLELDSPFGAETEGNYPIAFQITGTTSEGESVLTSERSVMTVEPVSSGSVSEASQSSDTDSIPHNSVSNTDSSAGQTAPSATLIIPLSADSTLTPGETGQAPNETPLIVSSESLADELAEGGRLDTLLDALESDPAHRDSRCLAIDPDTLTTIDRMTRGYFVATERDAIVEKRVRLRNRWTQDDSTQATEKPGRGVEDARRWLDRLRQQAKVTCTVALPWAGADLGAIAATGDQWLARQTLQEGPSVLKEILGTDPVERVVIPSSGYVTQKTLPVLKWAAQPLSEKEVETAWEDSVKKAQKKNSAQKGSARPANSADTKGSGAQPSEHSQTTSSQSGTAAVAQPVRVLVADNTVWSTDITNGESTSLAEGVTAYGYDASLSATLAATGDKPLTVGYTNPDIRFDYTLDSAEARDLTAQTVLRQALNAHDSLMIVPPYNLSDSTGSMLISTVGQLIDRREVNGESLEQYLAGQSTLGPEGSDDVYAEPSSPREIATGYGAPFPDPTRISDGEEVQAAHQATYVDELTRLLSNDPEIALRRYAFTAPLRRDIVRSLTLGGRASYNGHDAWVKRINNQMKYSGTVLTDLRASVALIPPGNVFTLTSPSSPLLVVAENRLPLPVVAKVGYQGVDGLKLKLPSSIRIPAAGSITTEITAVLPHNRTSTDLSLWLATRDDAVISQPVTISVQTRPLLLGIIAVLVLAVAAGVVTVLLRKKRKAS